MGPARPDQRKDDEEEISYYDAVEYKALSWCWGTDGKDCNIRINKSRGLDRLAATRELILAPKYQVQIMSLIYNCAT